MTNNNYVHRDDQLYKSIHDFNNAEFKAHMTEKRRKIIDEPLLFDSPILYLIRYSRNFGGFDIILDGSNNIKRM